MSSKRITHAVGDGRTSEITVTQHSAYGDLLRFGALYPPFGNQRCERGTAYGFGAKTLQALVDAGLAEWYFRPGQRRMIVEKGQGAVLDAAQARRERVLTASLYVTSRFFPPLPSEYGELAVKALEAYAEDGANGVVILPEGLNPKPRTARFDEDFGYVVDAVDLIDILRIGHMVDDFEEA